jgi:hypothetical protein
VLDYTWNIPFRARAAQQVKRGDRRKLKRKDTLPGKGARFPAKEAESALTFGCLKKSTTERRHSL